MLTWRVGVARGLWYPTDYKLGSNFIVVLCHLFHNGIQCYIFYLTLQVLFCMNKIKVNPSLHGLPWNLIIHLYLTIHLIYLLAIYSCGILKTKEKNVYIVGDTGLKRKEVTPSRPDINVELVMLHCVVPQGTRVAIVWQLFIVNSMSENLANYQTYTPVGVVRVYT